MPRSALPEPRGPPSRSGSSPPVDAGSFNSTFFLFLILFNFFFLLCPRFIYISLSGGPCCCRGGAAFLPQPRAPRSRAGSGGGTEGGEVCCLFYPPGAVPARLGRGGSGPAGGPATPCYVTTAAVYIRNYIYISDLSVAVAFLFYFLGDTCVTLRCVLKVHSRGNKRSKHPLRTYYLENREVVELSLRLCVMGCAAGGFVTFLGNFGFYVAFPVQGHR